MSALAWQTPMTWETYFEFKFLVAIGFLAAAIVLKLLQTPKGGSP